MLLDSLASYDKYESMIQARFLLVLTGFFILQLGCGVKSKPLAPLREPWISTGDIDKDREKKYKTKKQPPAENRVEFESTTQPDEKKELWDEDRISKNFWR